jgi:hypothetical protein
VALVAEEEARAAGRVVDLEREAGREEVGVE